MSDIYRCENCKYCVEIVRNQKSQAEFGNHACRRYPPVPIHALGENGEPVLKSTMVPVNHNWWCGEWQKKCAATS